MLDALSTKNDFGMKRVYIRYVIYTQYYTKNQIIFWYMARSI